MSDNEDHSHKNDADTNSKNDSDKEQDSKTNAEKVKSEIDLHFRNALHRPIASVEVEYLKNQMPFLQLINIEFDEDNMHEPRLIKARSGWIIHDYQEALSSSPGEKLWSTTRKALDAEEQDQGGDEGGGTIINQAYETAIQMIEIAQELGWLGISIVDGHRVMQMAAWIAATEANIAKHGFEPTAEEEKKIKRILRGEAEVDYIRQVRSRRNR